MMNSSPAVSIAGLRVKRGKVQVFDGLDLDLAPVSYTHLTLPTNREV